MTARLSTQMVAHLRQLEAAGDHGVPERRLDSRTVTALATRGLVTHKPLSWSDNDQQVVRWRVHLTDAGRAALQDWRS